MHQSQLRGEITAVLRNADTLEIEDVIDVKNVVLNAANSWLSWGGTFRDTNNQIFLYTAPVSPGFSAIDLPNVSNAGVILTNQAITGVDRNQVFPASTDSDMVLQLSGRWPQPAAARTIYSIGCSSRGTPSMFSQGGVAAYSRLAVPCVQETNQVLDVYYRVFAKNTLGKIGTGLVGLSTLSEALQLTFNGAANQVQNYAYTLENFSYGVQGFIARGWYVPDSQLTAVGALSSNVLTNTQQQWNWKGNKVWTIPFSKTDYVGTAFESPGVHINGKKVSYSVSALATGRVLQTIFAKRGTNPILFEDVDYLAAGTGKIVPVAYGQLQAPANPGRFRDCTLPHLIRIMCSKSGGIGDGEYRIQKVPFNNSPYANTAANSGGGVFNMLCRGGPETYVDQGPLSSPDFQYRDLTTFGIYGESGVYFITGTRFYLMTLGSGDVLDYAPAPWTDVSQTCTIGDFIYVGCRATGAYMMNPKLGNTWTKIAGIDKCYGVAEGYSQSLVLVTDKGMATVVGGTVKEYGPAAASGKTLFLADLANIGGVKTNKGSDTQESYVWRRAEPGMPNLSVAGYWWSTGTDSEAITGLYSAANEWEETAGRFVWAKHERTFADNVNWSPVSNKWIFGGVKSANNSLAATCYKLFRFGEAEPYLSSIQGAVPTGGAWATDVADLTQYMSWASSFHARFMLIAGTEVVALSYPTRMSYSSESSYGWINATVNATTGVQRQVSTWPTTPTATGLGDGSATARRSGSEQLATLVRRLGNMGRAAQRLLKFSDGSYLQVYCADNGAIVSQRLTMGSGLRLNNDPEIVSAFSTFLGWTGTVWARDVATGRPYHTTAQGISSGFSVRFEAGTGTSWQQGDYYQTILMMGLVKDNATDGSIEVRAQMLAGELVTDLMASVVPPLPSSGAIGPSTPVLANTSSTWVKFDAQNNAVFTDPNPQQAAGYNAILAGNWELSYDGAATANTVAGVFANIGAGFPRIASMVGGISLNADKSSGPLRAYRNWRDGFPWHEQVTTAGPNGAYTTGTIRRVWEGTSTVASGSAVGTMPFDGFYLTQVMTKVSNTETGGVRAYNPALQPSTPDGTKIAFAQVVANTAFCGIFVGNEDRKTGRYHPDFAWINGDAPMSCTIGGIPARIVLDGQGYYPQPGEVLVSEFLGVLVFNPADAGKAVTFSCSTVLR